MNQLKQRTKKQLSIVLLIDVLEDTTGGAERQVFELVRRLDKEQFNVRLCILHQDYIPAEIKALGIDAQALGVKRIYGLDGLRKGLEFVRFLKKERIDILMTYLFSSDIWGTYWGRKANARIISNRRDEGFWRKWFHILAYRLTNRLVDKVCVVSEAVRRKVITEEGVSPQKVSLLYSGVDFDRFETKSEPLELKKELGLTNNATIIGCVGNLRPVKGHKLLIEAAREILASFPNTHFVFVGEDEFEIKGTLEQEIQRHNVNSNIHLLGRRTDIPQLLQIIDICVLPSLSEGLSNTLLEYMAAGKPIVATQVGGNPELLQHKINGLLVKESDSEDLAENLIYLLQNREEGMRLGKKAKEDVEGKFSINKMVERYEKLFAETIDPTPAVVLGLSANGLSIVRSLGRKGIPVIGVDTIAKVPGMYSKYLKERHCIPNPVNSEDGFVSALTSIGKALDKKAALFATGEENIAAISKHREELQKYFYVTLPAHELVEDLIDKKKTAILAQKYNIAHPTTYEIHNYSELKEIASKIQYPCILKPQFSHLWRQRYDSQKVTIVRTPEELIGSFNIHQGEALDVLIQEIISGPDTNIYEFMAYYNRDSKPLAYFCCRNVRQYPPHFGVGCVVESINEPLVSDFGLKFLEKIRYQGLVHLEIKIDTRTQQPVLLEANIGEVSLVSGIDLPYIAYTDQINASLNSENTIYEFKEGIKLVNFELDLGSFLRSWRNKELGLLEWLSSFKAKKLAYVYFAADDLKPFFFVYLRLLKIIIKKLLSFRLLRRPFGPPRNDEFKQKYLKIAHIISSNGLFGAEKVMMSIASQINYNGTRSSIVAIENAHNSHNEVAEASRALGIPTVNLISKKRLDLGTISLLTDYIKKNNITLLHSHNYKANFIGLLAAKRAGIPIVATLHGYIGSDRKSRFYEALDRFILRYFNKVILVDKSLQRWFPNGNGKFVVVNNGIDTTNVTDELRPMSYDPKGSITIGTVGRLSPEKGHKYLLEAFSKITKNYPEARLLIVGDGDLKNELKELSSSLGIKDKVTFAGFQKDVSKYHNLMDIYVSSSLLEHFPLALLEAMSFGKAIVATDVGGTSDLIKKGEFTGLLIKSGSSDAIYNAILAYILQPNLRRIFGENARKFVKENYSLDKMIDSYKKVYEEAILTENKL